MKLRELRHNLWNIGFIEEGLEDTLTKKNPKIHWVKKRFNDRWFADPFILDVTENEIIVLAEEFCYDVKRGRIARVTIDRKTFEEKCFEIILDLPTHLSFPFILRKNGKEYILPENSASGDSTIYEYDDPTRSLSALNSVAKEPFTDATVFSMNGEYYLCSTKVPNQNGSVLFLYRYDMNSLKVVEQLSIKHFPNNIARNAGEVFEVNGQYYRPAQDCCKCYGHGVILQKIEKENGEWKFTDVNSIYPNTFRYNQGIHTFNYYKGLIVVDARGYRNPILGRFLTFIMPCIKYFK